MGLSEAQEKVEQPKIDKKLAKRRLWYEYIKGAVTVFIFLVGLALVTNFTFGYFSERYGYIYAERPVYRNIALLLSIVAYISLFVYGYKRLGFRITDRIDELKTVIDSLNKMD